MSLYVGVDHSSEKFNLPIYSSGSGKLNKGDEQGQKITKWNFVRNCRWCDGIRITPDQLNWTKVAEPEPPGAADFRAAPETKPNFWLVWEPVSSFKAAAAPARSFRNSKRIALILKYTRTWFYLNLRFMIQQRFLLIINFFQGKFDSGAGSSLSRSRLRDLGRPELEPPNKWWLRSTGRKIPEAVNFKKGIYVIYYTDLIF